MLNARIQTTDSLALTADRMRSRQACGENDSGAQLNVPTVASRAEVCARGLTVIPPALYGHVPEAREVRQRAELNMVFGNLQRGSMNDTLFRRESR